MGAVAGDGHVVGDRADLHVVEVHDQLVGGAADGEGVFLLAPRVRALHLEAVVEGLAEQSVAVEDAVAGDGVILGDGGIQEAGGQAA